jgi:tRNA modification GTPase
VTVNHTDTIAAISSATGSAARMIVRMSGSEAHRIAGEIASDLTAGRGVAHRTTLRFADLDVPAWVYVFVSPNSYTAQDLVEFHIPGNPLLARMLLEQMVARGARLAEAGEFTARAYFAGRIDLAEAEGVAATISAHSEQELRAARQLLAGELSRRLRPAMDLVAETLALLEAGIDFSDEDISFISRAQVRERVNGIDAMLRELTEGSARFERLTHEPTFVLLGRPNAGKSTLLNALARRERAVVSDLAGTTRDVLSAEIQLRRGMVRVLDVAGVGDASSDDIERQMMQQANRAAEAADFVVYVRDVTDDRPAAEMPRAADLVVATKTDLRGAADIDDGVGVSAVTGEGIAELRERLDAIAFGSDSGTFTLALNARHLQALGEARQALTRTAAGADAGAELVALELRDALDALGRVLGQVSPDDLLGRIFSTFCIGK